MGTQGSVGTQRCGYLKVGKGDGKGSSQVEGCWGGLGMAGSCSSCAEDSFPEKGCGACRVNNLNLSLGQRSARQIFKQRPIGNYCFLGKDTDGDIDYGLGQRAQVRPHKVWRNSLWVSFLHSLVEMTSQPTSLYFTD